MNTLQLIAAHRPPEVPWTMPTYATTNPKPKSAHATSADRTSKSYAESDDCPNIAEDFALASVARQCLDRHCHFHGRTSSIDITGEGDRLIVTGKLPSYYLKQLLQETLMRIDGVGSVENRVDVVNSEGVSSSPSK